MPVWQAIDSVLITDYLLLPMAGVAQLVRAPVCGTGGRGFNSHHSPHSIQGLVRQLVVQHIKKFF